MNAMQCNAMGSSVGAVVRALASPQCGPGYRRHMWVEFVVDCRHCSEGFSRGSPAFLSPEKPKFSKFQSTFERTPGALWCFVSK